MPTMRYNPWGINDLQNEINRLFSSHANSDSSAATASWMPSVDIQEYTDRFQLYVDLPGVDPDTVDITLDRSELTIAGERALPRATDEKLVNQRHERGHGKFHRRFILPDTVDADKVQASNRFGVLEITIAKQEKAQPRRIKVDG